MAKDAQRTDGSVDRIALTYVTHPAVRQLSRLDSKSRRRLCTALVEGVSVQSRKQLNGKSRRVAYRIRIGRSLRIICAVVDANLCVVYLGLRGTEYETFLRTWDRCVHGNFTPVKESELIMSSAQKLSPSNGQSSGMRRKGSIRSPQHPDASVPKANIAAAQILGEAFAQVVDAAIDEQLTKNLEVHDELIAEPIRKELKQHAVAHQKCGQRLEQHVSRESKDLAKLVKQLAAGVQKSEMSIQGIAALLETIAEVTDEQIARIHHVQDSLNVAQDKRERIQCQLNRLTTNTAVVASNLEEINNVIIDHRETTARSVDRQEDQHAAMQQSLISLRDELARLTIVLGAVRAQLESTWSAYLRRAALTAWQNTSERLAVLGECFSHPFRKWKESTTSLFPTPSRIARLHEMTRRLRRAVTSSKPTGPQNSDIRYGDTQTQPSSGRRR